MVSKMTNSMQDGDKMGLVNKVKEWLFTIALKKMIKRGVQLALAFLASGQVSKYGIDITGNEVMVSGAIYVGLEGIRNFIKTKWPNKMGWL